MGRALVLVWCWCGAGVVLVWCWCGVVWCGVVLEGSMAVVLLEG